MAEKAKMFNDLDARDRIMKATNPDVMKKIGRTIRNFVASEWDGACDSVVRKGNLAKFRQNPDMGKQLLSTGTKILAEASPYDTIWGIGIAADHQDACVPSKWPGQNRLGTILMQVREMLRGGQSKGVTTLTGQDTAESTLGGSTDNGAESEKYFYLVGRGVCSSDADRRSVQVQPSQADQAANASYSHAR